MKAASYEFTQASDEDPRRKNARSDSHHAPEAWCFRKGTLQAQRTEDWCSQEGTLQTQIPNEAITGLAPSVLTVFRAQVRRIFAFLHQRAKRTRGEKPRV